jgi:hypothetical protein
VLPQIGPSDQPITSAVVSSGGMIDAYAGVGQGCEPDGTTVQWMVRPTLAPGVNGISFGGRPVSRVSVIGSCFFDASSGCRPPYPKTVQVRAEVLVSDSVAYRWPAPGAPGASDADSWEVWHRVGRGVPLAVDDGGRSGGGTTDAPADDVAGADVLGDDVFRDDVFGDDVFGDDVVAPPPAAAAEPVAGRADPGIVLPPGAAHPATAASVAAATRILILTVAPSVPSGLLLVV